MKTSCKLTTAVPEGLPGTRLAERHRSACLRCQADEVRRRALLRELASLRNDLYPAPTVMHARVMASLGPQDEVESASRRVRRVVGGSVAAVAIGAAAVVGELARRRARVAG